MKKSQIEDSTKSSEATGKKHIRLNNNAYFVLGILLFIFALTNSLCLLMLSMNVKQDVVSYKENGNIDYKVYLKQNDFYDNDYLDKDMVYVASLINNVDTTVNYKLDLDKESNINYEYEIVGEIIIYNSSKESVFFKKEYSLSPKVNDKIKDSKELKIEKNIKINYGYYNNLATKFKRNYGVSSKSDFVVKLKLNYRNDDKSLNVSNNKELSLVIPLSENEVTIDSKNAKVDGTNQVLGKKHLTIESSRKLVSSIILACISLFFFVYILVNLFAIKSVKSKYDKYVDKVLREYDRLIVNTTSAPILNKSKVLNVNNFQELLDAHDNLGAPIMYYIEEEHRKCTFYVNHDDEVFVLKVRADDLEK